MKPALPGLVLLAALLLVPFLLRPPQPERDGATRTLVVLTSHNDAIRHEMARGFQLFQAERGQPLARIDWRSPGGTTELARILSSEYRAAFELYWIRKHGKPLSEAAARAVSDPKQSLEGNDEPARARREFLASNVGIKIDVLFGGGSYDFSQHAAAGRLVDSGLLTRHPKLFGEGGIPQTLGGEPYWDKQGRWVGTCLSGFGICYNRERLSQLGITRTPTAWADLADPRLAGHIALADPSKSGSANKAFEMLIQQTMGEALERHQGPAPGSAEERAALTDGFDAGMRLIRHIAGNSRYFTDQAGKVTQDIQTGSAAAGMCIDFYGRFQSDEPGQAERLAFHLPLGGSSIGSDPIALLRGAPAADLGRDLIEFVLSPAGQALWAYKRGVPGGPERHALRRQPILPALYAPERRALRSDPEDNPYEAARTFTYNPAWTAPLFRALSFVIRVMCVDTEVELHEASAALAEHGNPPQARAAFDDMSLVSYPIVRATIAPALASGDPVREVEIQNRLVTELKAQYERVTELARSGK
jgi:ABC-type Fe3+ transport system substrate-binding protein